MPSFIIQYIYSRFLRDYLPSSTISFNGVQAEGCIFDPYIPGKSPANYEHGLVAELQSLVKSGDKVIIVGGGIGVSTVVAARQVGQDGSVHVFEGNREQLNTCQRTVALNNVAGQVTFNHAVVGEDVNVYSGHGDAETIPATDLPNADVLVLDCEGAEQKILDQLRNGPLPSRLIVESHGRYGSPADSVEQKLKSLEYRVGEKRLAEVTFPELAAANDLFILTGVR